MLAWTLGSSGPALSTLAAAAALGFLSYGASLVLFVVALRHLGTARTGADEHTHEHVHDVHHQHRHPVGLSAAKRHTHAHAHEAVTHSHGHYPDTNHRRLH